MTTTPEFTTADYRAAADAIEQRIDRANGQRPAIGLILGSGLASLAEAVANPVVIPYDEIPGWPRSQVVGHKNRLLIGTIESVPVLVMQGRSHFYEGWTPLQVTFPIRVMQTLGFSTLIVTNAAGGLHPDFRPGDLMLITDHINMLGLTGHSPLMGPNDDTLGPRFPDMTRAYDRALGTVARRVARENGITLHEGVYVGLSGPAFETPAEVRMLRLLGGDAVGMSTVNEVTVARHGKLRVLGISAITNAGITDPNAEVEVNHEEVLDIGSRKIAPALTTLVRGVLADMARGATGGKP